MKLYLLSVFVCYIYQVQSDPFLPERRYFTEATGVCAGSDYEVGCGTGNGSQIMRLERLFLYLELEQDAFQCMSFGLCNLQMGGDGGDVITADPLLRLFKSIQHNCQGRPTCRGTLPQYHQVKLTFSEGSYSHRCGWDGPEYLSQLNIVTVCQDNGTIEELPPFEYMMPEEPDDVKTTTETYLSPTTTPAKPMEKTTSDENLKGSTSKQSRKGSRECIGSKNLGNTSCNDMWIIYLVVGIVVGLAVLIGIIATIYLLTRRSRTANLRSASPTEHPLNEKADLPLDDTKLVYAKS